MNQEGLLQFVEEESGSGGKNNMSTSADTIAFPKD